MTRTDVPRLPWAMWLVSLFCLAAVGGCENFDWPAGTRHAGLPVAVAEAPDAAAAAAPARETSRLSRAAGDTANVSPVLAQAEFLRGTGVLALAVRTERSQVTVSEIGAVTLNFANAEIREVIDAVLGDTLGSSYIIDPRVQGTVTIRTTAPLARENVIPVLEDALAFNGAAMTFADGVYRVLPLDQAAAGLTSPVVRPTKNQLAGGFGIYIVPLKFVGAAALRAVLEPFSGGGRVLRVDADRNLLIFAGTGSEARDLLEMVEIFDIDWLAGMSFALLPLRVADPKTVVEELSAIFSPDNGGPLAGLVRFMPIERLNAILAISAQPIYLDRAQEWVSRLDRGQGGVGRRMFVYYLENARAADIADILTQVFAGGQSTARTSPRATLAPGATAVELATPDLAAAGAEVAPAAAEPPQTAPAERGGGATSAPVIQEGGQIRIIADETNNAIVLLATEAEYRMIESTVRRLDVMPLLVLIEATIAEVSLTDELRYGLNWFFREGNNELSFSSLTTGAISSQFPGFSYLLGAGIDARVVLNALDEVTDVNVISSPQLMVLDNQSARLQVGDQVPIATQSAVSVTDADARVVNSIQYQDTGVILKVMPRVNAGGLVLLEIEQEVSSVVATTTSQLDSPTIQQRQIQSTIAVQSGETIALGGLIRDDQTEGFSGVPLLGRIPLLGSLFRVKTTTKVRTELLILITPHVVGDQREARAVTEELRSRMRTLEPLEQRIRAR